MRSFIRRHNKGLGSHWARHITPQSFFFTMSRSKRLSRFLPSSKHRTQLSVMDSFSFLAIIFSVTGGLLVSGRGYSLQGSPVHQRTHHSHHSLSPTSLLLGKQYANVRPFSCGYVFSKFEQRSEKISRRKCESLLVSIHYCYDFIRREILSDKRYSRWRQFFFSQWEHRLKQDYVIENVSRTSKFETSGWK